MDVTELDGNCYLTDGQKLFRVLRTWLPSGQVLLEDAGDPGSTAVSVNVKDLVRDGVRVVRPVS